MAVLVKACEMELQKTPNRHSVTAGPTAAASFGLAVEVLLGEMQARSACYNIAYQTDDGGCNTSELGDPHPHPLFFVFSLFLVVAVDTGRKMIEPSLILALLYGTHCHRTLEMLQQSLLSSPL